jgi:hypothetical protein
LPFGSADHRLHRQIPDQLLVLTLFPTRNSKSSLRVHGGRSASIEEKNKIYLATNNSRVDE